MSEESELDRGLIVIPGISSGPYGTPFDEVVDYVKDMEYSVVRLDTWKDAEDLEEKTLKDIYDLVDEAFEALKEQGCDEISVLGKSFGGQIALTYPRNSRFELMILWAPAVGLGKNNVNQWKSTSLKHASSATDISVDAEHLENISSTVKIVHGSSDQVVPVNKSRTISEEISDCELEEIEGADHSFSSSQKKLISKTESMFLFTQM